MVLPAGPRFVLLWLLRYTLSPYRVWRALARRYGDPFFVRLPESPGTVATGNPAGVKAIISADAATLVPWRLPSTEALLTEDSIFLQAGDAHRQTRRMLAPLFQPVRHDGHIETMAQVADAELARLVAGPLVVHGFAQRVTLRIILATLFGLRDGPRADRFHAAALRALGDHGPLFLFLRAMRGGRGAFAKVVAALEDMRALVQVEIDSRRAANENVAPSSGCPHGGDMLDQLLRARRADGAPLSDREIQVHLADMVVAGHETTTVAIAWTCYELCRHPAAMARAVAELADKPLPRTAAELAQLPWLEAVCHESLRLHAPLVFLTREVARPLVVNGCEVAPGHGVSLALPLIHGDPATFESPDAFKPERFLGRSYGPHQYLPFGGGAKRCLGASFAVQEMMVVLAGLLARFELRLRRDRPVRARARAITIAPVGGVELVIAPRAGGQRASGRSTGT
jgi:cytochrome P450